MDIFEVYPDLCDAVAGSRVRVCRKPTLILAMTARTGSTHLAALLAGSGQMAAPDEILNPRSVAQVVKWKRNVGDFAGLIEAVNVDPYPWFGFKACFQDFGGVGGVF